MKKVLLVLVLVLGIVPTANAADVIKGCYKKINGQFRVLLNGKTCLPSESAVSFLGGSLATNLNPMVYDADNQFLGIGQAGDIYIPSLRKWTTINLSDVSGDLWSGQLYYQSSDCTGQPYAEYEYLHRVFGNGQPEARSYYTAAPDLEGYVSIGSYADGSGNCQPAEFEFMMVWSKAVPVQLPFRVPVALPTVVIDP